MSDAVTTTTPRERVPLNGVDTPMLFATINAVRAQHVILERGRVAERGRSERWDSLRLLTPNWLTRLPGLRYDGPDPDGFMDMPELADYLGRFASSFRAPLQAATTVTSLRHG